MNAVARELGMSAQTLRDWLKAAEFGKLTGRGAMVVTPEQIELSRLRAENKRLQMELEIAIKVEAFFAKFRLSRTRGFTKSAGIARCRCCAGSFA